MTFYGIEIGEKPTLQQIEVYIAEKGFYINPQDVYNHYEKRGWKTKKNTPIISVESMVNSYNGVILGIEQRELSRAKKAKKLLQSTKPTKNKLFKESDDEDRKWLTNEIRLANQKIREIKTPNIKSIKTEKKYHEQLTDSRWYAFRKFVFAVRGRKCEICGDSENLNIHHLAYRNNALAWEYNVNEVMVLCHSCHCNIHNIKH